jgi:hypothetical protein
MSQWICKEATAGVSSETRGSARIEEAVRIVLDLWERSPL